MKKLNVEIWKNVPFLKFEEYFQVSNLGRVRVLDRWIKDKNRNRTRFYPMRILQLRKRGGYLQVRLCLKQIKIHIAVHRLVATIFVDNINNKPQVNHKNGIKTDNRVENLEWMSASENMQHSFTVLKRIGPNKGKFGENSPCSKSIVQYTKDNQFVAVHKSLIGASFITKIDTTSICKACKGVILTAGGFVWKYETLASFADKTFEVKLKKGISQIN